MKERLPLVSIIIPNYNHGKYLTQRIESILKQEFSDYEIILLDDSSSDNSKEIISKYSNHPAISHIELNEQNSGSTFIQWNKGLQIARGKYIWIAESDDFAAPSFLSTLIAVLESDTDIVLAYSGSHMVDTQGQQLPMDWDRYHTNTPHKRIYSTKHFLKRMIWGNRVYNASMAVFQKECIENIPEIYSTFRYCGDWLFWSAIGRCGKVAEICDKLNYFRQHTQKVSPAAEKKGLYFIEGGYIKLLLMDWLHLTEAQRLVIKGKLWKQLLKIARHTPELERKVRQQYPTLYNNKWKAICYYLSDKWLNWSGLQGKRTNS